MKAKSRGARRGSSAGGVTVCASIVLAAVMVIGSAGILEAKKGRGTSGSETESSGSGDAGSSSSAPAASSGTSTDPNHPGVLEPISTLIEGAGVRIPHTDQADGDELLTVVGGVTTIDAEDAVSLLGHSIIHVASPNDDMEDALDDMFSAAKDRDASAMRAAARDLRDILMGTTQGRIYDGFAMLNFNRGAFVPDHVAGEYKMKTLRDTGLTEMGIAGEPAKIWELDVNMFYYDGQIDSDTFLMRVPEAAGEFDTVRVNYRVYSVEREDFSPTVVMLDRRLPRSVQFPFKGFDSVWIPFGGGEVLEFTMALPPLRLQRGVYTWGWRVHPPRIQFLQPIFEHRNAHTNALELEPQGESFAFRNRQLSLEDIGAAAPEMKMYRVAMEALAGASPRTIKRWMGRENAGPRGTWTEWADLAEDQRQLPPEAWDVLADEGIGEGDFGPYRLVTVYMNNEMYGDGPEGSSIQGWEQGDQFSVKLINLDNHTHYFRNVDFGTRLHDDISGCCGAGSHSFEVMNFKPTYGAPKVAEMQWRAGWGFRPHFDVVQQPDVFPRASDRRRLTPFFAGSGAQHLGWQYSAAFRGGDFRFNPPPFIITDVGEEPDFPLREADGSTGLLIGQRTEGYGIAQMCPDDSKPGFCQTDISQFNPNGAKNFPAPNDPSVPKTELRFPPFLRNPGGDGGDIIPPTGAWKPFLWLNPSNGTLFIDPSDESKGYWADLTYSHGAPVFAGESLDATVEAPRGAAQVFYQFDDLFHDNAIFSPHPTFEAR